MVSARLIGFTFCSALLFGQTASQLPDTRDTAAPSAPAAEREVLTPEKRADIYMARKMYREAIDTYKQADMHSAIILNKVGIAYHQLLDFDSARKYYEGSLKINPKYSEALNNLGTVYYARKSYRRSIAFYRKSLAFSPQSASVYSNLGTAWFARKNYKEAAGCYQTALKLDPEVFEHRSSYGILLQERSVGDRARFHYYLAKTYATAGVNDRALQYIRKALEEGFRERKKFVEEPEFANLQELPEFKEIMSLEPRVL